ncbi:hypothetical protein ABIA32_000834 [Streptacidiphilus sp. MAP12-20]|uniref:hypothetical protein n=1 Tax=Streptacidiphilus sp. MAP12-20 TaxID=3156299 RepID=UPI0035159705
MPEFTAAARSVSDADASALVQRLLDAADRGEAAAAYFAAAALAQLTADRLQGAGSQLLRIPADASFPVRAGVRAVRIGHERLARSAVLLRGRLGLEDWHVTIRDLTNVLAEAVLIKDYDDRAMALIALKGALAPLRAGLPSAPARWLGSARPTPSPSFARLGLRPADCVALAGRFAQAHPDRDRVLLVLGVRPEGCFLAPLIAAALTALDYRHVVCRSVRTDGALLPEEPRLVESVRRIGGVALLCAGPPSSGAALGRVAARLVSTGFATERVLPVYPSLARSDAAPVLAALRAFPAVVLSAEEWQRARRNRRGSDGDASPPAGAGTGRPAQPVEAAEADPTSQAPAGPSSAPGSSGARVSTAQAPAGSSSGPGSPAASTPAASTSAASSSEAHSSAEPSPAGPSSTAHAPTPPPAAERG